MRMYVRTYVYIHTAQSYRAYYFRPLLFLPFQLPLLFFSAMYVARDTKLANKLNSPPQIMGQKFYHLKLANSKATATTYY